jgi:riboflavin synthase
MFTGIVEELGEIVDVEYRGDSAVLVIRGPKVVSDTRPGDSIAVSGVCLTVVGTDGGTFGADVMAETLKRSTLGARQAGDRVNLERAVPAGGRLGGHVVQGHVDGTGVLLERAPSVRPGQSVPQWDRVRFGLPAELARYVAEKGSVAVDGVSLTVTAVGPDWFEVGLIPTTLDVTTLGAAAVGDTVNLEVDVLAKYVARLLEVRA